MRSITILLSTIVFTLGIIQCSDEKKIQQDLKEGWYDELLDELAGE